MADVLNANGLQTSTYEELKLQMESALTDILGVDVDFSSNTPDGNLINNIAIADVDIRSLIKSVFTSYNPNQAQGLALDNLCVLNGIVRKSGTFTLQEIEITTDRNLNLEGLDDLINSVDGVGYTVADNAGNEFILANSASLTTGVNTLIFRAKNLGAITTVPNTITNPVSVVVGVLSVNNSSGALEIGTNAELDSQLRIRRAQSLAINSNGGVDSAYSNLINLNGVVEVKIYENKSSVTDANGIPSHSIWAIVEGGSDNAIANVLYKYIAAGCGYKGDVEVVIYNLQDAAQIIKFDRPAGEDLYIRFDLKKTVPVFTFDIAGIKNYISTNLDYSIAQPADTSSITATIVNAINSLGGGGVPLNVEISKDGISWQDYLDTTLKKNIFITNSSIITITEI